MRRDYGGPQRESELEARHIQDLLDLRGHLLDHGSRRLHREVQEAVHVLVEDGLDVAIADQPEVVRVDVGVRLLEVVAVGLHGALGEAAVIDQLVGAVDVLAVARGERACGLEGDVDAGLLIGEPFDELPGAVGALGVDPHLLGIDREEAAALAADASGDDVEGPLEAALLVGDGGALAGEVAKEEGGLALAELDWAPGAGGEDAGLGVAVEPVQGLEAGGGVQRALLARAGRSVEELTAEAAHLGGDALEAVSAAVGDGVEVRAAL